jgi:hypothetical protein
MEQETQELDCLNFLLKTLRFFGFWHKKKDYIAYTIFGIMAFTWQAIYLIMNLLGNLTKAREWKTISAAFEDLIMGFSSKLLFLKKRLLSLTIFNQINFRYLQLVQSNSSHVKTGYNLTRG